MRVKELLLAALSRANHIEDGTPADARELNKARNHFNSALSKYSDSNLITAFQRVVTVTGAEEQIIGKYNMKRGKIMHVVSVREELPDPQRLAPGKDFAYVISTKEYGQVIPVSGNENSWRLQRYLTDRQALVSMNCCDYIPDVIVAEIERIVAVMVREKGVQGAFSKLNFVPLTSFYTESSNDIYCAVPVGDSKVKLLLPEALVSKDVRIVYNTSMKFDNDDYIELPEVYCELLTLAVTVGLLSEDADSDPTQLNNYSSMLEKLENQIMANNVNTRRIVRNEGGSLRPLHTGAFICGRFK